MFMMIHGVRVHIDQVLALEMVDRDAIKAADLKVAIDCVNSVGGIIVPGSAQIAWCQRNC